MLDDTHRGEVGALVEDLQQTEVYEADLMRRLGQKVRSLRNERNIPRRTLAEISGVSPRYLAKLEAGEGNVSITVLAKVARAFDVPIELLIAYDTSNDTGLSQVIDLYRKADAATRTRVFQVLNPTEVRSRKASRICLVGLRGAGKSTLGSQCSDEMGVPFVELNAEIENDTGMPVGELIALYGQEGYRQLEADTLNQLIDQHQKAIIAVAGGIVSNPSTFHTVLTRFHTVWIKASSGEHMDRVRAQGDKRPMDGNPNAMIQLRQILKTRETAYAEADFVLDTSGQSVANSQKALSDIIRDNQLLGSDCNS